MPCHSEGIKIGETGTDATAAGLEYGYLTASWEIADALGNLVALNQRLVIFHTGEDTVTLH